MAEQNSSEALGENKDTSVTVSRTVSFPVKRVWQVLVTDEGAEALLGPGSHFGDKGHTWSAVDGRTGVIRTFHPLEEIRFSWRVRQAEHGRVAPGRSGRSDHDARQAHQPDRHQRP